MKKTVVRAALAAATVSVLTGLAVAGAAPAAATAYPTTFVSPSGNISCLMSTEGVRCDIDEAQWREADCDGHGSGRTLGLNERAGYLCSSDYYETRVGNAETGWWDNNADAVAVPRNGATMAGLRYGSSMSVGQYTCYSETTGVACVNHRSGAGFWLAREGYVTV